MKELSYNLRDFRNYIKGKKLLLFGAGAQGLRMFYILQNWDLTANIIAYIDNNIGKRDTFFEREQSRIPIIDVNAATNRIEKDVVLIICNMDVYGVKNQLNNIQEFDCVDCFNLTEIVQEQLLISDYPGVVKMTEEPVIPKIIHYAWFGTDMPTAYQHYIQEWRELCPDYEFILWNESNYDVKKNQYMKEAYENKVWGFVPDYLRMDVVYEYGGIYLDTDIRILKNLDDLLYQEGFGSMDSSLFLNMGSGFGAKKHQELIGEFLDYYKDKHFIRGDGSMDRTACSIHQYQVLRKYGWEVDDRLQTIKGMNIYPMIMQSTNVMAMQMRIDNKAYLAHYGASSWIGDDFQKRREMSKKVVEKEGLVTYQI